MALNREQEVGNRLSLNVSAVNGSGTGNLVQSGDPEDAPDRRSGAADD